MTTASFIAPEIFAAKSPNAEGLLQFTPTPQLRKHLKAQRVDVGEQIRFVDGQGNFMVCELVEPIAKGSASISFKLLHQGRESEALKVILVQGISATDRMDLSLRQACELGVSEIIPLLCQRSKVRLSATDFQRKQQRWQRIVTAAAEQSGRATVPVVQKPTKLAEALLEVRQYDVLICPWEDAQGNSINASIEAARKKLGGLLTSAAVFVGPEGGFDASEVEQMVASGAQTVTLGKTILRTETASTVALALVTYALGGLGADA